MAVYERTYRPYAGPITRESSRFLVLPRYAFEEVFRSRLLVAFLVACFVPPLGGAVLVYLRHNLSALAFLDLQAAQVLPIDELFFRSLLSIQGTFAFLVTMFVGPALVSPDLRNNGLALYLSRPFSRSEYILGKMSVLMILLSSITWVPGILLFLFQASLQPGWLMPNLWLAGAILAGSWTWILFLSLLALTISAWVKWKPLARVAMIVLFFVSIGFANAINGILNVWWGTLISAWYPMAAIWDDLFGMPPSDFLPPPGASWATLAAGSLLCLWLLSRRIRAYEVVR